MEIAVIGAGSHFTLNLLRSIYQTAPDEAHHIRLMDTRHEALEALTSLASRFNAATGGRVIYSVHDEQKQAIAGADQVLVAAAVEFPSAYLRTCWVMKDHGINFVEGETATPGALMATMRHLPVVLSVTDDVRAETDSAWVHIINNPMPRLVRGVIRGRGYKRVVGHCHGTIAVRRWLGTLTGVDDAYIDIDVAGINHFHLVRGARDRRNDDDLLAKLEALPQDRDDLWREKDFSQWKMYHELGYLIGHGIWHNFDYLPYANPRMFHHKDLNTWDRANIAVLARRQSGEEVGGALREEASLTQFLATNESEQVFKIMRALEGETDSYEYLSGNVENGTTWRNLPEEAIIEVPSIVSGRGVLPRQPVRGVPLFFETWVRTQLAVHELSVAAVVEGSRQAAIEAIATDPAFRDADCSPAVLLDEMLAVNEGLVPPLS